MATYILQRCFAGAGTQLFRTTVNQTMAGNNGGIKKGFGNLNRSFQKKSAAYDTAKKDYLNAFNNWSKTNGASGSHSDFQATMEGKAFWDKAQTAKTNMKNVGNQVGNKAGVDINKSANQIAHDRVQQSIGRSQVGIGQGIANTWHNAGTMGKVGMATAATAGTALMANGVVSMFNKDKDKD